MAVVLIVPVLCCMSGRAFAEGDPYLELATFDFGSLSTAPATIEKEFRDGGPAVYGQVEQKLLTLLAKPGITLACKKVICQNLRIVGSKVSVKPLLPLLCDEKTSDLARFALESIPGKDVDSALLKQLKQATDKTQIGIIQSLATRRNTKLADILQGYLDSKNVDLVRASLQALARVGGADAMKVLRSAKVASEFQSSRDMALIDAAYSVAAEGGTKKALAVFEQEYKVGVCLSAVIGAFNGLIDYGPDPVALLSAALKDKREPLALAAAKASTRMSNDGITKILCETLQNVAPEVQVAIIRALAERGDKAGAPVIKSALASVDKAVQSEAVSACEKLGDSSMINDLMRLTVDGVPGAQQALSRIHGEDVNCLIQKLLDDSDTAKVRVAIAVLKLRDDRSVIPRFLRLVESDKSDLRMTAIEALEGFADESEIQALLALLGKNTMPVEQDKIAMVLWRATRAMENDDARFAKLWGGVGNGPESIRSIILPLASAAGGEESLKVVTEILKSGSDVMKDRAARTLFKWQNEMAVKPLVDLIKGTGNEKYKILGMQAVVRLFTDKRSRWSKENKEATLKEILPLMSRPEDKQALENAITRIKEGAVKK